MAKITLFVYGTLKRGCRQNHLVADQEFVGAAQTLPYYRLFYTGSYPCLVEDRLQGLAVKGELWSVNHATLAQLDHYEDVPRTFIRQEIEIAGQSTPVLAYFYQGDVSTLEELSDRWPRVSR
jgi:gamma-glutamylaminecyclotransferase